MQKKGGGSENAGTPSKEKAIRGGHFAPIAHRGPTHRSRRGAKNLRKGSLRGVRKRNRASFPLWREGGKRQTLPYRGVGGFKSGEARGPTTWKAA